MKKHLATYINDHLSGAAGALVLLETLTAEYGDGPIGDLLSRLEGEISWEREQLVAIVAGFTSANASPRRVAAWIAEKGLEVKLSIDGAGAAEFRLFEALEALSVGIAGKRLLWRALALRSQSDDALVGLDYVKLINMAVRQREAIEPYRLAAAEQALMATEGPRPAVVTSNPHLS